MNKDEVLEEIIADVVNVSNPGNDQMSIVRQLRKFLPVYLGRYAMRIVEQSVPAAVDAIDGSYAHAAGWNSCRNETFEKARELTNQTLKQNEN